MVVGDVALIEPGEVAPCDGIFLSGYNVKCDESAITGESDAIKKLSYAECLEAEDDGKLGAHTDCFILSGSKILEGVGSYVVIAVGVRSFNGRIMMGSFLLPSLATMIIGLPVLFSFAHRQRVHTFTVKAELPCQIDR